MKKTNFHDVHSSHCRLPLKSYIRNKSDARFHMWFRARLQILLTVSCLLCSHHRKFDYITSLLRWLVSTVCKLLTTFAPSLNCNTHSITSLPSCRLIKYSCWGAMHSPFAAVEQSAYEHIKSIMKWTINNKELIFSPILTLRLLMSYIYIYIYIYIYVERLFLMFPDHTQLRSTVGRTPLDEWSARRRDLYLATHDTRNREISMPPVGFEPKISAGVVYIYIWH